ncbi:MAG: hypothetical protein UEL03_10965 [Clostridium sp.]|uniref:hypothetical protein n=1 Tax=Clostridium sp. TaxID=1506 RepID=UPI0025D87E73|nr:hypothetical protein [Clostridium sp.]MEE0131878.1 hypothetical protein [Clostridium sp.]
MAKFCMYCGKPLNGETCDCPQAVAEAEKKARMKVQAAMQAARGGAAQPQNQQAAQIQYQQPVQPQYQQSAQSAQQQAQYQQAAAQQQTAGGKQIQITAPSAEQAAAVGKDVKNLFTGLFTAPVETMRQAAASANKIPQYLMAAVMAVAMILLACVTGKSFLDGGTLFGLGLKMAIGAVILRAVYGAVVYVLAKKHNPALTIGTAMGVYALTFAYDAVILLLQIVMGFIHMYEISIALYLFWFAASVLSAYLAAYVLTGENAGAAFRINLMVQLVFLIVMVFVIRGIGISLVQELSESIMNEFMGGMGDLGSIF